MDVKRLAAAILICLCFGSIHAYGVLLAPVEQWLGISRTIASLGYSLAVASLTIGVWLNGEIDAAIVPRLRLIGCGVVAAVGLMIAARSGGAAGLLLGFGVLYGLANGVAYALSLGSAARSMPGREAQAMGLATAAYGLGAVLSAQFFGSAVRIIPVPALLLFLALVIAVACAIGILLLGSDTVTAPAIRTPGRSAPRGLLILWVGYLFGAFSGLMVLAHAPAIAAWRGGDETQAGLVAGIVSFGSVAGGLLGGLMAERSTGRISLAIPLFLQAAAVAVLSLFSSSPAMLAVFGLAGLCYGALIAIVPAEVRRMSGQAGFARSYGSVFSAWGLAGIAGPVMAGYIYDMTAGYGAALAGAAALSFLSGILIVGKKK